jgi:hypothetical protein
MGDAPSPPYGRHVCRVRELCHGYAGVGDLNREINRFVADAERAGLLPAFAPQVFTATRSGAEVMVIHGLFVAGPPQPRVAEAAGDAMLDDDATREEEDGHGDRADG